MFHRRAQSLHLLLLPLLLAFAQTGGWLHELTHLYYSAHSGVVVQAGDTAPDSAQCPTCQSFAQVGTSLNTSLPPLPVIPAATAHTPAPLFSVVAAAIPTPRSRGPPLI